VVAIRATTPDDLGFVLAHEYSPAAVPYIGVWTREQHLEAIGSPSADHLTIEAAGERAGYAILLDLDHPHGSLQLKRIVVSRRGEGIGGAAMELIVDRGFSVHGAHRLWLDMVTSNDVARRTYERLGFVEEGVLREVWRNEEGRQSLSVMSILDREWAARHRSD
jgi:ribosomal protein S18 acetylase RimI-like enzyme